MSMTEISFSLKQMLVTARNSSGRKIMFLHLSDTPTPRQTPPRQTPPLADSPPSRQTHPPWADTLRADTNTPRWPLQWTVRVVLECILVVTGFIVSGTSSLGTSLVGQGQTVFCDNRWNCTYQQNKKYTVVYISFVFRDSVSYCFFVSILLSDLIFHTPAKRDELPKVLEWLVLIWVSVHGFAAGFPITLKRTVKTVLPSFCI